MKLYTSLGSGNAYKAELMVHLLGLACDHISVSIPKSEHRDPAFLKINPFGQIPVLVDGERVLTDSQAILCYLAHAYGGDQAEGGIDTGPFPAVTGWLRRVESLPGFWPMPRIPNLPPVPLVPVPEC